MEVNFNYTGIDIIYQCKNTTEKINDIFHSCRNDIELNSILFFYSGMQIDGNLPIKEIINDYDLERNKMLILLKRLMNLILKI